MSTYRDALAVAVVLLVVSVAIAIAISFVAIDGFTLASVTGCVAESHDGQLVAVECR